MKLTNQLKDALLKDECIELSYNFDQNPSRNAGPVIDVSIHPQMPVQMTAENASLVMERLESGEGIESASSTDLPETSSSTQAETVPDVKEPSASPPPEMNQPYDVAAITSRLNLIHRHRAAVEKEQEYALEYHDKMQIQGIQNFMLGVRPIPITDNVNVKISAPVDTLPSKWKLLLIAISVFLNVPIESLISVLFAVFYTTIRGKYRIEVMKDYCEALTEYFIVVMHSGSKKSAIVNIFKSPINKYVEKLQCDYDNKYINKEGRLKIYKNIEKNQIKTCARQIDVNDLSEIDHVIDGIEKSLDPLRRKLIHTLDRPNPFNDSPTMKKLGENLRDQNEFISFIEEEPGFLKNRISPKENTIFLKGYMMESYGSETSTNGSVLLHSPCIACCFYTQPGVASKFYSNIRFQDDGLLPRFLPVYCLDNPTVILDIPQCIDPVLMAMYEQKINSIMDYTWAENGSGRREIEILRLTEDASQEYFRFSQKVSMQTRDGKFDACRAFASKLAGHAVRLAGIIHFLEHDKPRENSIGLSAMRSGIAFAEFYAEHAIFAFNKKQNDSFVYAEKILKWVKRLHISDFEHRDAHRAFGGRCKSEQIEAGIDLLIKNNYLAQYLNYKRKMVYIVNPNAFREDC